ncbi:uncharacterized protein LOC126995504 [Eriocheir sinensis]|uniref:uncharacterized protein LOC126995504 n=1 Tax=Eriocheir sinensis TaxID=95602 RepID=UPI0021C618F8|nr:uncharacterized protein LOC126995504 [Eriocheir sinensis]
MKGHGVIVKYSQLVDGSREELSCSGIYLGHGVILTHGTLLVDLLKDKRAEPVIHQLSSKGYCAKVKHQPDVLNSAFKDVHGKCQVILPSKKSEREAVSVDCDPCNSSELEPYNKSYPKNQSKIHGSGRYLLPQTESDSFLSVDADIDRIFLQHGIQECMASLMPTSQGWKLLEEDQSSIPPNQEKLIMSTFVLLTLSENEKFSWISEEGDNIVIKTVSEMLSHSISVNKGNFIYIESSPFGSASPNIFLNSLSHGIICNASPEIGEVLLTDARCITGSEGAPVFAVVNGQRHPCAIVMSPFCWRGGEWLGLTLLASLGPVLQTLLQSYNSLPKNIPTLKNLNQTITRTAASSKPEQRRELVDKDFMKGLLQDVTNSVVCIKCGDGWGSGLVISTSPGIILTCAHVVNKAIDKMVTVLLSEGRRIQGKVIHQTSPLITCQEGPQPPPAGYSMWDLAVVATPSPLPHALPLATSLPQQGVGIIVAGYGMFPPWILPSATLSRGVISKVVSLPSASLDIPSHLTSNRYSREKMPGVNSNSDASLKTVDTNHHNFNATRHTDDTHEASHALMQLGNLPTGRINKCVPVPVVMQTTCAVYAGGSGGPVVAVHPSHGLQVVGVVVCNMRDSNNITFPNVNLAIPIPTIATILNTFLKTGDETVLLYLDVECTAGSHLWGLTHPSRSHL